MDRVKDLMNEVQEKVYETKNKILRDISFFFIVIIGMVFLFIGIALIMPVIFGLPAGSGFIIIGALLLIIALIIKAFWD